MNETLREIMKPCTMYDSGQSCGIFVNLYTYATTQTEPIEIPFLPDLFTAQLLDTVYFDGHSGQKRPAPLVRNLIDAYPQKTQAASVLASMFWALHGANLLKQFEVVQAEYNPIENYNMIEHIHDYTDTEGGVNKVTNTHSGGYTDETKDHTTENAIYGFDSTTSPKPSDKTTEGGTVERTYDDDKTETETEFDKHTDTDRSGNIGTTTSQMMLQSQIDLWQWNFYNNYLFPVVDSVLTLLIY